MTKVQLLALVNADQPCFWGRLQLGFQTLSGHLLSDRSSHHPDYSDSLPSPAATSRTDAVLLWSPGASPMLQTRLPCFANVSDSFGLLLGHTT